MRAQETRKEPHEEPFVTVAQLKGWNGAQTKNETPQVPRPTDFLKHQFRKELKGSLSQLANWVRPPFFRMSSPQGTELEVPLDCHWLLMFSLMLDLARIPCSSYKVHGNHKRKLVAEVGSDGKLFLTRNDQTQEYQIAWALDDLRTWWCETREVFERMCERHQQDVHAVQRSLLEVLIIASPLQDTLRNQVRRYCYSTNAWWTLGKDESVTLKVTTAQFQHSSSATCSESEMDDTRPSRKRSDSSSSTTCSASDSDEISCSTWSEEAQSIVSASPPASPKGMQLAKSISEQCNGWVSDDSTTEGAQLAKPEPDEFTCSTSLDDIPVHKTFVHYRVIHEHFSHRRTSSNTLDNRP